jgi:solute carrier family 35 (UDP-xylose/UDP-N-acetylglucosamine transporter), member B4
MLLNFDAASAIYVLFGSCTLNSISMESIIREEPRCGMAMTFWQFVSICIGTGIILYGEGRLWYRRIPLRIHLVTGLIFFMSSTLNNAVFAFGVSVPLHMLVRSSSMMTTVVVNYIFRGTVCSRRRLVSVAIIMVGMLCCIDWRTESGKGIFSGPLLGNILLICTLFLSSILGVLQEESASKYGTYNALESMFYMHMIAMPMFFIVFKLPAFSSDALLPERLRTMKMLPIFAFNTLAHFFCTFSGFKIFNSKQGALTGTLLITLRKGISLILSALLFGTHFEVKHWVGAIALLGGTINYFR